MNIDLAKVQKVLDWVKKLLYLDSVSVSSKKRLVKRGQVYWCDFGCAVGSEMQKNRPAVIIQNDLANSSSGNTIVIPITHDTATISCMAPVTQQLDSAGNVILDGQANTSNLMCVSKARLGNYICNLPNTDMIKIGEALARTIDLMKHYAKIERRLEDKLLFIAKLKKERNNAQDELVLIRKELGIGDNASIVAEIKRLQASLDIKKKK